MLESISDCPRNFTTIQCGVYPVNRRFPQNFQMISTLGIFWSGAGELPARSRFLTGLAARFGMTMLFGGATAARNSMSLPMGVKRQFRRAYSATAAFATTRTEDKKLRKELCLLGGPCFEGTLRNGLQLCFPNEVPWPGRLRTLNCSLKTLDAGHARELQQNPAQPHICSR
jgi:hypothetical protein